MNQALIFQPMLLMVALVFVMYLHLIRSRFAAVKSRELPPKYFRLLRGDAQPEQVEAIDRNLINLFELPVLFYAAVLTAYVSQSVDGLLLTLAWVFAISRVVHSVIHVTANNVMHRLRTFVLGFLSLAAFWLILGWRLVAA